MTGTPLASGEPLVSVVVPNFNGERLIRDCLTSVLGQTYPRVECLVVDDGSTDGSVAIIEAEFPEVLLVRRGQNGGFARAANDGLRKAQGEIIALLNNDAAAGPTWVEQIVATFRRHPEAGSVATKMVLWDSPRIINSAGDLFRRNGVPDSRGVWETDAGQYDQEVEVFGASGGAGAYRRQMLDEIGYFDERFFMYCEDVDLAFRAQTKGFKCIYAPEAVVRHRLSATGGGPLASYQCGRNFIWILARDFPALAWRRYWPRVLMTQLGLAWQAVSHLREPAARARLRGQFAGLRTMPQFVAERRMWAQGRRVSDDYLVALLT